MGWHSQQKTRNLNFHRWFDDLESSSRDFNFPRKFVSKLSSISLCFQVFLQFKFNELFDQSHLENKTQNKKICQSSWVEVENFFLINHDFYLNFKKLFILFSNFLCTLMKNLVQLEFKTDQIRSKRNWNLWRKALDNFCIHFTAHFINYSARLRTRLLINLGVGIN